MADRMRGIIVKVLDLDPLKPQIIEFLQTKDPTVTDIRFGYRWSTIVDEYGRHHLICDEGVGAIFSDDSPIAIDAWDNTERFDPETGNRQMSLIAAATIRLTPADVADLPVTEEVDLADFIREFGARLERNFWINYETITTAP